MFHACVVFVLVLLCTAEFVPASNDLFEAGFYGAHHGLHAKRNHRMQKAFEVCTWIGGLEDGFFDSRGVAWGVPFVPSYTPENQRLEPKNWWFIYRCFTLSKGVFSGSIFFRGVVLVESSAVFKAESNVWALGDRFG